MLLKKRHEACMLCVEKNAKLVACAMLFFGKGLDAGLEEKKTDVDREMRAEILYNLKTQQK